MPVTRHPGAFALFVLWFALCSVLPRPLLAQDTPPVPGETQDRPDEVPPPEASADEDTRSPLRRAPELDPASPPESGEPAAGTPSPPPAVPKTPPPDQTGGTKDGDFLKRMFTPSPEKKEADRFDIDYSPTKKSATGEKTPIYKHWLLWTLVGVAAFTGTFLIIQYGVDRSDSLTLDVTRQTP